MPKTLGSSTHHMLIPAGLTTARTTLSSAGLSMAPTHFPWPLCLLVSLSACLLVCLSSPPHFFPSNTSRALSTASFITLATST